MTSRTDLVIFYCCWQVNTTGLCLSFAVLWENTLITKTWVPSKIKKYVKIRTFDFTFSFFVFRWRHLPKLEGKVIFCLFFARKIVLICCCFFPSVWLWSDFHAFKFCLSKILNCPLISTFKTFGCKCIFFLYADFSQLETVFWFKSRFLPSDSYRNPIHQFLNETINHILIISSCKIRGCSFFTLTVRRFYKMLCSVTLKYNIYLNKS